MMVRLWFALACRVDGDHRMVRQYADCMADPNIALHRLVVSNAVETVPSSAAALEERLRAQPERGEVTMTGIRADYARYCEWAWMRVAETGAKKSGLRKSAVILVAIVRCRPAHVTRSIGRRHRRVVIGGRTHSGAGHGARAKTDAGPYSVYDKLEEIWRNFAITHRWRVRPRPRHRHRTLGPAHRAGDGNINGTTANALPHRNGATANHAVHGGNRDPRPAAKPFAPPR